jgi:multidrug efflux pump subunit AcrB
MRNTLILIGRAITTPRRARIPFHVVIGATVQWACPVLLTAMTAILAFIPLTHSVFRSKLAYTLIGDTLVGTIMMLVFLPAMCAIWLKIRPGNASKPQAVQPV